MRRRDHERIMREIEKAHDSEVRAYREMLDRLMYTTGATWTPPPQPPDLGLSEEFPDEPYSFAPEHTFDAVVEE